MDILEKQGVPSILVGISNKLAYEGMSMILAGSASLASQLYTSDYDFITKGGANIEEWMRILKYIADNVALYFIELKVQYKNGEKEKFYKIVDVPEMIFKKKNISYIKIDLVVYLTTKVFKEVSVIYSFVKKVDDKAIIIKSLKKDLKEYVADGKYYKALKRYFSIISKVKKPNQNLKQLSIFFNSAIGKEYQKLNNLKAIKLVVEKYDDALTLQKLKTNLKDIGYNDIKHLDTYITDLEKNINKEGKDIYDKI